MKLSPEYQSLFWGAFCGVQHLKKLKFEETTDFLIQYPGRGTNNAVFLLLFFCRTTQFQTSAYFYFIHLFSPRHKFSLVSHCILNNCPIAWTAFAKIVEKVTSTNLGQKNNSSSGWSVFLDNNTQTQRLKQPQNTLTVANF